MSAEHYKVLCCVEGCNNVVAQCRCMLNDKTTTKAISEKCTECTAKESRGNDN